ncbi:hypothetical protein B0H13DRAFT_1935960 [Mycena leptocephala]|nr:hypothetical protein B0H13DRAFT_1935960 [Mycena leptocephala]
MSWQAADQQKSCTCGEIEDFTDSRGLSIPGKWFRWCGLRGCSQCVITEDGECIHAPLTLERRRTTGRLGDGEMRYVPATGGGANQSNALGLPPNSPIAESTVVEATTTPDVKLRATSRRRMPPLRMMKHRNFDEKRRKEWRVKLGLRRNNARKDRNRDPADKFRRVRNAGRIGREGESSGEERGVNPDADADAAGGQKEARSERRETGRRHAEIRVDQSRGGVGITVCGRGAEAEGPEVTECQQGFKAGKAPVKVEDGKKSASIRTYA